MNKILSILQKYGKDDHKLFKQTIDTLCDKGIANGCYQDYVVLMDILSILGICENYVLNND